MTRGPLPVGDLMFIEEIEKVEETYRVLVAGKQVLKTNTQTVADTVLEAVVDALNVLGVNANVKYCVEITHKTGSKTRAYKEADA